MVQGALSMRSAHRLFFLGLVIGAALVAPGRAADAPGQFAVLEQRFRAEFPADGPGAYVIATRGDRTLFSQGFGLADVENALPLAAESVVRIASLTKQFTAVGILWLVQHRKLGLDSAMGAVWPQCPPVWCAITIRQLLSHTSGITDDLAPLYAHVRDDLTVDELLALYRDTPLLAKPQAQWRYSNVNYWILGKLIEILSGETYAQFITQHVLVAGMNHTRYGSHAAIIMGRANGYEADGKGGWLNARYFSQTLGYSAGGFLSTPTDMALWYGALARGALVSPKLIRDALSEVRTADGKGTGYGLGWYLSRIRGDQAAAHGGSTFGFQSFVYWLPQHEIFVGVFKNSSDERGEPRDEARAVLDAVVVLPLSP
jgi:CubicO group peptidase (beta-lactamase class C family)